MTRKQILAEFASAERAERGALDITKVCAYTFCMFIQSLNEHTKRTNHTVRLVRRRSTTQQGEKQ
jgi:hypothetical protein